VGLATCSGDCAAGYACPAASTSASPPAAMCASGRYAAAGATSCSDCVAGQFSTAPAGMGCSVRVCPSVLHSCHPWLRSSLFLLVLWLARNAIRVPAVLCRRALRRVMHAVCRWPVLVRDGRQLHGLSGGQVRQHAGPVGVSVQWRLCRGVRVPRGVHRIEHPSQHMSSRPVQLVGRQCVCRVPGRYAAPHACAGLPVCGHSFGATARRVYVGLVQSMECAACGLCFVVLLHPCCWQASTEAVRAWVWRPAVATAPRGTRAQPHLRRPALLSPCVRRVGMRRPGRRRALTARRVCSRRHQQVRAVEMCRSASIFREFAALATRGC
jgi:hypothetical protein